VWRELVRLARRGDAARARVLVLYSLLLAAAGFAFVWAYPGSPLDPVPPARAADFATSLAVVLLEVQLVIVAAATPAFAAAAVSGEKDRRTLDLLLTTGLTDREVVFGKAAARVLFVLAAAAAGLPLTVLLVPLGGAGAGLLAAGYALTAGTAVLSAGIGVGAACRAADTRGALVRAYSVSAALLVPPLVLLSPFAMLLYVRADGGSWAWRAACGFGYPAAQVLIGWALLNRAARDLRAVEPGAGPVPPTAYPEPPRGRPAPVVFAPPAADPPPRPPLGGSDPVLWKERYAGRAGFLPGLGRPGQWLAAGVAVVALALFVGGGWEVVNRAVRALDPEQAERFVRAGEESAGGARLVAAGVLAAGLYLVPLAAGVGGCVAGERLAGTLDPLLATPLGRRRVLWAKVRAHAERGLVFAGGAAGALGAGFGTAHGTAAGLAAVAAFAAGVGLVAGLGAWASVRSPTPARAFRVALPAVVLAAAAPALAWHLPGSAGVLRWAAVAFAAGGVVSWWRAGADLNRGA
jgi:ABC-type Na+ efflux pump permease subunit